MLIRSIYGETPEGTGQAEDRCPNRQAFEKKANGQSNLEWGPNTKKCIKHFREQRKLGWLRRHPRKAKPLSIVNKIASK